jgi:HSP20 family molecular chaperone IbpA
MTSKPLAQRTAQVPTATPERPRARTRSPAVSITENDDSIILAVDLPGVPGNQAEVTVENGVLNIRGQVAADTREGATAVHREYEALDFERSFTLPEDADGSRVSATSKNGVLRVVLPKRAEAAPRRIAVTAG